MMKFSRGLKGSDKKCNVCHLYKVRYFHYVTTLVMVKVRLFPQIHNGNFESFVTDNLRQPNKYKDA